MEAGQESQSTRGVVGWVRSALPVLLALAAGLALRLWMLKKLFFVDGDSLIYGDIAKNLLLHCRYALTGGGGQLVPTLIRLPGYPLFVALCFRIFGIENYFAVACVQITLDLLTCLLVAAFVRRIFPTDGRVAALATLWSTALCPFTASYTTLVLAETLTLFALALAMWAMARVSEDLRRDDPRWGSALWLTFALTAAALLRPEGLLAALAFSAGLGWTVWKSKMRARKLMRMATVCVLLALAPFAVWTWRNWRVFHVVEPLAPRLANDPGEATHPGWERWVKSWCLDFNSTYEVYWNVPGSKLDMSALPKRAFDSPAEYATTLALANDYNSHGMELTPEMDGRFAQLAWERIAAHPLRYYVWLPLGRVTDMWLRPRVENLPIDIDWWVYSHHHVETEFSWAYVALNAVYLLLALVGLCMRPRFWWALLAYMVLRSALLLTIAAPETRYTIECFPMLFALGGVALSGLAERRYLKKVN